MFQRVKPEGGTKIRTLRGQRNEEGNSIKLTELYGCTNGSTLLRRLRAVHRRHTNLIPVPDNRTHAERGRIFWPRSRFFDIFLSSTYFRWEETRSSRLTRGCRWNPSTRRIIAQLMLRRATRFAPPRNTEHQTLKNFFSIAP